MKALFPILALLVVITACEKETGANRNGRPQAFFDLKGYIQKETQRLSSQQPRVLKRISIDGEQEEKTFDTLDYSKELAIFSRSDINKTAWFAKYQADSTFSQGQLQQITYAAKDKKLKTRLLEVRFDGQGAVSDIHISNVTESLVADVRQDLAYQPAEGYSLTTRQSTALSDEKEISVVVKFR
ncbi:MAG: hypothetical protein KDC66_12445 [Phaeodactylibacter sp.]|nr:hypothetical protein [Phaeodactylibacter sp.]MCB9275072.1 hypothetical protein [Lewinellaceae bacterium]